MARRRFWSFGLLVAASVSLITVGAVASSMDGARSSTARGRAIATRSGCLSCHGADLSGKPILSDPTIAILFSSNLTRVAPRYTDAGLDVTIRTGVRPDGSRLWFMAAPYAALNTGDMADLIAFLRSRPAAGDDHGRICMGPRFIKAVNEGRLQPEAVEQARDRIVPPDFGPRHARGRYLARTICAGCHYPSLGGMPNARAGDAPDLIVAAGYDRDQFRALLHNGKAPGGREVGLMSEESRKRFASLSNADVDAIGAYLVKRASEPVPAADRAIGGR